MKAVLPFLVAGFIAVQTLIAGDRFSAQDLLALEGESFLKAADDVGYDLDSFSVTELATIAEKLLTETKNLPRKSKYRDSFSRFFMAACSKAKGDDLARLVEIYTALEPGTFDKEFTFKPLAAAWIRHEIDGREWTKIELPALERPLPDELKDAPKDLIESWQLFQRSKQLRERSGEDDQARISSRANEHAYYALIDRVLLKQGDHLVDELAKFYESGTSAVAMFMALLAEGRVPEAFGVAVEMQIEDILTSDESEKAARVAFLQKCGVDWETILAGAQIDAELNSNRMGGYVPYLRLLALFGSERAATLLTQMAARAKPPMHDSYAYTLSAFLPKDTEKAIWSSRKIERDSNQPNISFELQTRIVDLLQDFAKPDANSDVVEGALDGLSRAKSLRTKPTLRALLKHRSPQVAQEAARILEKMGESVELPRSDPVRFQIMVNGAPAPAALKVSWDVDEPAGTSVHNTTDTNESGTIDVPREHLLPGQQAGGSLRISSTNGLSAPEAPSYVVTVPIPKNLDETTRVEVQVWPVDVRISRAQPAEKDLSAKAFVKLQRHEEKRTEDSSRYSYFDRMEKEFEIATSNPLHLSLQRGSYDIEILAPGAEQFIASFEAGPNSPAVTANLKPGGDVRFEIVRPGGERDGQWWLLKKDKKVECAGSTENPCRGLPLGEYVLHIPSTAELMAIDEGFDTVLQPFAGRDIPFTISEVVPVVDLGEIHLDPAN